MSIYQFRIAQRNEPIPPVPYFFFSTVVGSGDCTPLEDADFSRDRVAQSASGVAVRGLCHLRSDIDLEYLRVSQSQS